MQTSAFVMKRNALTYLCLVIYREVASRGIVLKVSIRKAMANRDIVLKVNAREAMANRGIVLKVNARKVNILRIIVTKKVFHKRARVTRGCVRPDTYHIRLA